MGRWSYRRGDEKDR